MLIIWQVENFLKWFVQDVKHFWETAVKWRERQQSERKLPENKYTLIVLDTRVFRSETSCQCNVPGWYIIWRLNGEVLLDKFVPYGQTHRQSDIWHLELLLEPKRRRLWAQDKLKPNRWTDVRRQAYLDLLSEPKTLVIFRIYVKINHDYLNIFSF